MIKYFKLMTVELSKSRENLDELAKELGIRVELIYRWRTEFLDTGAVSFTAMANLSGIATVY